MSDDNFEQLKQDYLRRQSEENKNPFLIFVIAIILIVAGVSLNRNNQEFMEHAKATTGIVYYERNSNRSSSNESHYTAYAEYNVNGKKYYAPLKEGIMKALFGRKENGSKRTIYYNPNKPKEIRDKSCDEVGNFFIGFGGLVLVGVVGDFIYRRTKKIDMNDPTPNYTAAEKYADIMEKINNKTGFTNKFAAAQNVYFSMRRVFTIITSILVIAFGIFAATSEHSFSSNAKETISTVTNITKTEKRDSDNKRYIETKIYVKYNVNGKQYEGSIISNYSDLKKGSSLKIYYNQKNPNEINITNKNQHAGYIIIVVGFTFLIGSMMRKRN